LKNNETVPQLNKKNFSNFINLCSKIQTTKPTSKMNYSIKANSVSKHDANLSIKQSEISFGTTPETAETLPNPAELFLGSFSACILKNVERFSVLMNFEYTKAEITVSATRLEKPPRMDDINYELKIYSKDNTLNIELLKKNIEKHGTIFNTVQTSCTIVGNIEIIPE
jgi:uncharacterized OsmC-like protein